MLGGGGDLLFCFFGWVYNQYLALSADIGLQKLTENGLNEIYHHLIVKLFSALSENLQVLLAKVNGKKQETK